MPMRPRVATLLVVAVALTVGACSSGSSSSKSSGGTSGSSASGATVTIKSFQFTPGTLQAKAGQVVTVRNTDGTAHTLTADDRSFDSGQIAGGASSTITPAKAGLLPYHCSIHNYMKGTIQVS